MDFLLFCLSHPSIWVPVAVIAFLFLASWALDIHQARRAKAEREAGWQQFQREMRIRAGVSPEAGRR